jgi:MFS family permease
MKKYYVLAACFLTVFVAYAIRYSYGVILPKMLPSLGVTKAQAGAIYAWFFVAYNRWLISGFVGLLGAGALLMSFSTSVLWASVFYTLVGIGAAACWAPVMALARRWTDEKSKGRTLAIVDVGSALGIIAAGSGISRLVAAHGWETAWIWLGAAGLVMAVFNLIFIRHSPAGPPPHQVKLPGRRTSVISLLGDLRFWLIGLAYLLTGFAILIPFTFLSTYAVEERAFPYGAATGLITVIGASAIAGKLILGPLSDKIKRIRVMMICAALIMAGSLGMAFGWRSILPYVFTLVFGLGYGAAWAMYAAVASDYFAAEMTGGIVGLWTMYLGIGSVASPVVAGWIGDITGSLRWSFITAAAAGALSLLLLVPVWRARPLKG